MRKDNRKAKPMDFDKAGLDLFKIMKLNPDGSRKKGTG